MKWKRSRKQGGNKSNFHGNSNKALIESDLDSSSMIDEHDDESVDDDQYDEEDYDDQNSENNSNRFFGDQEINC
jgi:hypothetical protein